MNETILKADWQNIKGKVREQWGKLTGDDIDEIAGQKDQLIAKVRKRYGRSVEEAEREIRDWERSLDA